MSSHEKQLVIYGAGGWLGQSFVSAALDGFDIFSESNLVLIGSKSREIKVGSAKLKVHSSIDAGALIKPGAIFVNSAFLRREYLTEMSAEEYAISNNKISKFAEQAIERCQLSSFINLSSGAAATVDGDTNLENDIYGGLKKKWEIRFRQACSVEQCNFINNRIYSVSGRYLNEFNHLALSIFIRKSLNDENINVKSPKTLRSYIDAEQLSEVLIRLGIRGFDGNLDSGGTLVNMEQLANLICNVIGRGSVEVSGSPVSTQNYFGKYQEFNDMAESLGVEISDLKSQVLRTLTAFT